MGYYTYYTVETDSGVDLEAYIERVKEIEGELSEPLDTLRWVLGGDSCKWYGWKEDMIIISKNFPGVLFTITGEGEEGGDLWIAYVKEGKVQVCEAKITYDEYDESKLE